MAKKDETADKPVTDQLDEAARVAMETSSDSRRSKYKVAVPGTDAAGHTVEQTRGEPG